MYSFIKPFIFNLDPEVAHDLAIQSLKFNFVPEYFFSVQDEEMLQNNVFGQQFSNPIGLAAGFDKNAEVYNSLFKFGFGFVEVGTITPQIQLGNPKPRIFRLEEDKALINRLGFNNQGMDTIKQRIKKNPPNNVLGINIGPNKNTKDKITDFLKCYSSFYDLANYITINISSPNTENLRDFHNQELLQELIVQIKKIKLNKQVPLAIKLSPDTEESSYDKILKVLLDNKIEVVILTNTTDQNRTQLMSKNKIEKGGLSGLPLRDISSKMIRDFYKLSKGRFKIIGVGGIDSGESAFEKISYGASLVQLYTSMVYQGPNIVKKIKEELIQILRKEKIDNISKAIGINS
jgi:dihydroorotate dehydrogenase